MRERLRNTLNNKRQVASLLMVVIGLVLLGYVGAQYADMYLEQRRLEAEFQMQEQISRDPNASAQAIVQSSLTKVQIPKIDLDAIVVEGTSNKALKVGPGRIRSSALPGEPGNAVITAHRDTFFRHIYELNKGDEILIRRAGKIHKYEVTGKKIVKPTDVSVLRQTSDAQLTLITCYPIYFIGPAPERLVVFSRKTGEQVVGAQPANASTASADSAPAASGGSH